VTKIDRRRDGGATVRFEGIEVAALRDLTAQVAQVLGGGVPEHGTDPIRDRLFPRAYVDPTEDRAETDFQSVVHEDLVRAKADAVAGLLVMLGASTDRRDRLTLELDRSGVEQWVGALNDVRLTIGVVLGVTEDDDGDELPPDDPRAAGMATYHWLTWVQGTLVEVLMERM
jgi:Domain of unknown function (DUF2017)